LNRDDRCIDGYIDHRVRCLLQRIGVCLFAFVLVESFAGFPIWAGAKYGWTKAEKSVGRYAGWMSSCTCCTRSGFRAPTMTSDPTRIEDHSTGSLKLVLRSTYLVLYLKGRRLCICKIFQTCLTLLGTLSTVEHEKKENLLFV
jgi:hypothetical protein